MSAVETILIQIAVILLLSRMMGLLMRTVHQPQVVGEMIAGIILGPSLPGVLMNTRGLKELIILNIGLTFGVLSKALFAMMVVMALATTFMTAPLMRLLYSPARQKEEMDEAARRDAEKVPGTHMIVPVSF